MDKTLTHADQNSKFTIVIDDDYHLDEQKTITFTYIDYSKVKQYMASYHCNDDKFQYIQEYFMRDTFEDLMANHAYVIQEIDDSIINIRFDHKVFKREFSILIELLSTPSQAVEGKEESTELAILKDKVANMSAEMKIMKEIIMRDSNKIRFTESYISNEALRESPKIIMVSDAFICKINAHVIERFAKIINVKLNKIGQYMRIDVNLELYSKECYYLLAKQGKQEVECKTFDTLKVELNEKNNSVFLGSYDSFEKGVGILGLYLILADRRNSPSDHVMYNHEGVNPHSGHNYTKMPIHFTNNQFPLNSEYLLGGHQVYPSLKDRKGIDRDILEKLVLEDKD